MGERERGKGNFKTSQSVPCGALLVCCCHSCCLGGHEGHRDPGGRGTGHRSLTSLKSISWQLAAGKLAISNHQVPDHLTHIFQNLFLNLLSASSPQFDWTRPSRARASWSDAWRRASGRGWKSAASPELPLPCPQGHQALHQASE